MSKLYVMCGIPGSGKSTFIANHINNKTDKYVSRDEIRFSMVAEDEEYFSKEKEVFNEFADQINKALSQGYNVFADATHLNEKSRNKLLRAITEKPSSIECIWMRTPLEAALERNENRKGTRSYVPRGNIRRMFYSMTKPLFEEGFNTIYIVRPNKPIKILKEG